MVESLKLSSVNKITRLRKESHRNKSIRNGFQRRHESSAALSPRRDALLYY